MSTEEKRAMLAAIADMRNENKTTGKRLVRKIKSFKV